MPIAHYDALTNNFRGGFKYIKKPLCITTLRLLKEIYFTTKGFAQKQRLAQYCTTKYKGKYTYFVMFVKE